MKKIVFCFSFPLFFIRAFFVPLPKQPEQLSRCAGCGVFYPPDEIQAVYYEDDYPIHLCSNCS